MEAEREPEGTARERPDRERSSMDYELERSDDALEREAEEEAAAEAAAIGGPAPDYEGDEAERAVEEGGEVESDLSTAEYGEADEEEQPDA